MEVAGKVRKIRIIVNMAEIMYIGFLGLGRLCRNV